MATRIGDMNQSLDVGANRQAGNAAKSKAVQNQQDVISGKASSSATIGGPVDLSQGAKDRAADIKKAKSIVENTPDVREDKIAAIKERIRNGTYQVDSGMIADGMMREAIREHLSSHEDR